MKKLYIFKHKALLNRGNKGFYCFWELADFCVSFVFVDNPLKAGRKFNFRLAISLKSLCFGLYVIRYFIYKILESEGGGGMPEMIFFKFAVC